MTGKSGISRDDVIFALDVLLEARSITPPWSYILIRLRTELCKRWDIPLK